MTQNTHIQVTLTPNIRLEQALKGKDIATVTQLSIAGAVVGEDFLFIRKNIAVTLQEFDMSNAMLKNNPVYTSEDGRLYKKIIPIYKFNNANIQKNVQLSSDSSRNTSTDFFRFGSILRIHFTLSEKTTTVHTTGNKTCNKAVNERS
jgi:hypothetical protein